VLSSAYNAKHTGDEVTIVLGLNIVANTG